MGQNTKIEWAHHTNNLWIGCHRVSPGCRECYMDRVVKRMGKDPKQLWRTSDATFYAPRKWKSPARIFVNSLSDFWHESPEVNHWRFDGIRMMMELPQHRFLVLTKRIDFAYDWLTTVCWPKSDRMVVSDFPDNIALGVSVENQNYTDRILTLLEMPVKTRFLSCEPLLGPLDLRQFLATGNIHWVITGGESGSKDRIRKADPAWFRDIRDQCEKYRVAYFHKQNGGYSKDPTYNAWGGREIDGQVWNQFPEHLRMPGDDPADIIW